MVTISFSAPDIFNTEQGAQFTSADSTKVLRDRRIKISMDAKGRCDNVFVERLWRSLKYEEVYFYAHANRSKLARASQVASIYSITSGRTRPWTTRQRMRSIAASIVARVVVVRALFLCSKSRGRNARAYRDLTARRPSVGGASKLRFARYSHESAWACCTSSLRVVAELRRADVSRAR
jgi:transposase InsO family protein